MAAVLLELIPELIELAEGAEAAEGILSAEAGFDAVLGGEVAGLDAVGGDFIAANEAGDIGVGAAADDATADVILENVAEDAIADTLPTSRMKWLISNTKRFGKWAAIEAGKAAIIQVGFEALLAVIKHLAERPDSPTIAQEAKASAEGFMGVLKRVFAIVNEWHAFGQKHLAKGRMYGVLIVNHVVLLRFELYVRQLAVLDGERGKVLTAVADAKKKGTPEAVLALRPVLKAYVDQVADLGKWIEEHEPLMKHDGLAGRVEELQEAQHTVNVA